MHLVMLSLLLLPLGPWGAVGGWCLILHCQVGVGFAVSCVQGLITQCQQPAQQLGFILSIRQTGLELHRLGSALQSRHRMSLHTE